MQRRVEPPATPPGRSRRNFRRRGRTPYRVILLLALTAATPVLAPPACAKDSVYTDAEGQSYTLKRLSKKETQYRKLDGGWVRVAPYFQYRLEREDDQYLYVREYIVPPQSAATPPPLQQPAGGEAPADAAPASIPSVDRLTFAPFSDGLPMSGQWRNRFVLADMNGDTHLDIVHGPPRKGGGGPRIFLGDSAGHWKSWNVTHPPGAYDYGAVAVADFNGDTHLDIALAAHLRGISVLLGDGRGRFRVGNGPADFEPEPADRFTTRALIARDWNRDGAPDLVAMGEGPIGRGGGDASLGWRMYLNQRNGRWLVHAQPPVPTRTFGDALAVADFNEDGHDDLLTASLTLGNRDIVHYGGSQERTVTLAPIRPLAFVYSVASGDFDGDGRDDVAVGYLSHENDRWQSLIDMLFAQPDETWRRVVVDSHPTRTITHALAAGDADGDGHADLAAADDTGTVRLFLGDGAGRFALEQSPEMQPLGEGCRGYHVQLVDLNGDKRDEIVAAFASEVSPMSGEPGCPNDGRLQAWSPKPNSP